MKISICTLAIACTLGTGLMAASNTQKTAPAALPASIVSAFQQTYPKAHIQNAQERQVGSKTFYEITSKDGETQRSVYYRPDGTVARTDETIQASELPQAVHKSLDLNYPQTKLEKAEKVTIGSETSYAVQLSARFEILNIRMDPAGKVLKAKEQPDLTPVSVRTEQSWVD